MFAAALLVFFVSGFAALVYQVIWQRLLTIFREPMLNPPRWS